MSNLATCFGILGRHEEAQRLHDETLALRTAKLGPDHPDTLESMNQVALVHAARRRFAEALDLHEKALALRRDTLGPDHPDTLASRHDVAECLDGVGRHPDALRLREETLPLLKRKLGVDHPHTLWFMHLLADSYDTARRRDDARKLRREAVDLARNRMGPGRRRARSGPCTWWPPVKSSWENGRRRFRLAAKPWLWQPESTARITRTPCSPCRRWPSA